MSDEGKTFEEILSENLAMFGWTMAASDIPEQTTAQRVFNDTSAWYHSLDERTRLVVNNVDLSEGMELAGFFAEWPALKTIFAGRLYGTNEQTVANFVTCFENAHNRQFQPVEG
jgi:hypothetical protein